MVENLEILSFYKMEKITVQYHLTIVPANSETKEAAAIIVPTTAPISPV